jgi:hypothetical protein
VGRGEELGLVGLVLLVVGVEDLVEDLVDALVAGKVPPSISSGLIIDAGSASASGTRTNLLATEPSAT